jgi:hypothetical protein
MASTYTSRLKLEKQGSGENSGNWGNLVNYVFNRVDSSVKGYQAVSVAGSANVTLTSNTSTTNTDDSTTDDQVHNAVLEFTGTLTGSINVFTDAVENQYVIFNNTAGAYSLTFAPTGGTGVVIPQGSKTLVYTNGTVMYDVMTDLGDIKSNSIVSNGAVTITGNTDITGNLNLLATSSIRFQDTTGGEFIGLKANGTVANSVTFTLPVADGTINQVLTTNGSGALSFATVSGGASWQAVKTSGFTAVAKEGYFCNTTSSAFTATLPVSATIGDFISFIDYAGTFDTNNLTIGRNGHNIQGVAEDLTVSVERAGLTLVYVDATQGWLLQNK